MTLFLSQISMQQISSAHSLVVGDFPLEEVVGGATVMVEEVRILLLGDLVECIFSFKTIFFLYVHHLFPLCAC